MQNRQRISKCKGIFCSSSPFEIWIQPRLLIINITHYCLCFCWWTSVHGTLPGILPLCLVAAAHSDFVFRLQTGIYKHPVLQGTQNTGGLCILCFPLSRRTEKTEEGGKHYNYVQLCTGCVSVWLFLFHSSKESWICCSTQWPVQPKPWHFQNNTIVSHITWTCCPMI